MISTEEDSGLRTESFAVLNLRLRCFHKQNYYMFYRHANIQRTYYQVKLIPKQ
jgi:hypothetical protein